jgi:hypothetical protein
MIRTNPPRRAHDESHAPRAARSYAAAHAMRLKADCVALVYIGFIASVASLTGVFYLLFPELAALSWDVMERPRGRWADAPLLLALTPPLTGVIGTVVTRTLPYGFVSVLITVIVSVAIIRAMRSPIAPAISAGLLPLVLGVTSWWYPAGILFGTTMLAAVSIPWKRYATSRDAAYHRSDATAVAPPSERAHDPGTLPAIAMRHVLAALIAFVAIAIGIVKLTGMRFVLFPPLVVILYEMLSHRERCPWVGRPVSLPLACFMAAAGGYFICAHTPFAPLAAMLSMAWGIAVLRILGLHMPPVLAVALLPLVMAHPTVAYPFAVGIGTTLASAWYVLVEKWQNTRTANSN